MEARDSVETKANRSRQEQPDPMSKRNMALTREHGKTVVARIKRDRKFGRTLYSEAMNALLEIETNEGLSMLRDSIHR